MCAKMQTVKTQTSPCSSGNILLYAFKRENKNWCKTIMCTKINKNWSPMYGKIQTVKIHTSPCSGGDIVFHKIKREH